MDDHMTVAIFVAGEDLGSTTSKEYLRYRSSMGSNSFEERDLDGDPYNGRFGSRMRSMRRNISTVFDVYVQGIKYLIFQPEAKYAVIVVRKNEFLQQFTDKLKRNHAKFESSDVQEILKFVSVFLSSISDLKGRRLDIAFFAHWHAEPISAEDSFNDSLAKFDSLAILNDACKSDISILKFIQFAVSSRLPERINLSDIHLPGTVQLLKEKILAIIQKKGKDRDCVNAIDVSKIDADAALNGCKFLIVHANEIFARGSAANFVTILKCRGANVLTIDMLSEKGNDLTGVWPLFFGTAEWHENFGATSPEEFKIVVSDDAVPEVELQGLSDDLVSRVAVWKAEPTLNSGVNMQLYRDWCAGAFRLFCRLDRDVHGDSSGSLNLKIAACPPQTEEFKKFWDKESKVFQDRLSGKDLLGWQLPLWEFLFPERMRVFREIVRGDGADFYKRFIEEVIVNPCGGEVAFATPVKKIDVLLIDDDIEGADSNGIVPNYQLKVNKGVKGDAVLLADVFSVTAIKIGIEGEDRDFELAVTRIKDCCDKNSFDAILLDLHLGKGDDPAGYQLIRVLKILLPTIPIIVYSSYDDMGHIARAFKMGAMWYIKKDEVYKLPRHFISLLSSNNWWKEWRSIRNFGLCDGELREHGSDFIVETSESDDATKKEKIAKFRDKFNGDEVETENKWKWKYLTYKALERFPGRKMYLRPMGGGFSKAATFRVLQKDEENSAAYQSPVIVKIDREFYTRTEFERYYRFIRPYIANESGRVENNAVTIDADNSAIVYTFAGKCGSSNELLTFRDMLEKDIMNLVSCRYDGYARILDDLFKNILPRIHNVPIPSSSESASQYSSYPNHAFGERDAGGTGFVANYRVRMPLSKHYEVTEFCDAITASTETDIIPFEFKDIIDKEGIEALELLDDDGGEYSKMTVILSGDIVRHVIRFRSKLLIPGKKLFVKVKVSNATIKQEDLRDILNKGLAGKSGSAKVLFSQEESKSGGGAEAVSDERYFINLFESFSGISKSDYSFDTIVKCLYQRAIAIIENDPGRFACREGIVHGDLNFANIMIDRRSGNAGGFDVWLIDFARTRRDVIAHDFNVFFTATLAQLFKNELWYDERQIDHFDFAKKLLDVFHKFAVDVIFGDVSAVGGLSDVPPDYVANDRRLKMVYQILRRVRKAAIDAKIGRDGTNQEDVYAMTTALCCLYTFRIFLKHEHNVQGAAALLAIAYLCLERLDHKQVTKVAVA